MKLKNLILAYTYLLFIPIGFAQIVNSGTLKINASTTVYFGDEYTNKTGATHNNDGDLYLNSNFINNGTTVATAGTTYFVSATNAIQTISGSTNNINFYNLQLNLSAVGKKGVSVVDNFGLFVKNSVSLLSGDLRLVGEAQLIQTHTGITANTNSDPGKLLRDQQGIASTYGYNFWSSPVNNGGTFSFTGNLFDGTDSSINSFAPQQIAFSTGSPYNGTPSVLDGSSNVVTPLKISTDWLYKYSRGAASGYASWVALTSTSTLSPGEGYTMKGSGTASSSQNYVFKGVPNDGTYTFSITSGESSLLGNPYPSALDCTKFINDNLSVVTTLYFWVDGGSTSHYLSDYLGGYATRNLTGGTPPSLASSLIGGLGTSSSVTGPSQYMAVGQGFFVEAVGTGTITFDNSQRVFQTEGSGASTYYKTSSGNEDNTKSKGDTERNRGNSFIRIGYEDPEGFHRQLLLGFLPESPADINYNPGYDALMSDEREDELFYIIENDFTKKYVIQGVGAFDINDEFPLGLKISQEGQHTIMLDTVENIDGVVVFLKDKELRRVYDLSTSNFKFDLPAGEYLNRFSLVFKSLQSLGEEDFVLNNEINVYYNKNKGIVINNQGGLQLDNVFVFNTLGQKITQVKNNLLNQSEIIIPFNQKQGMYLVVVSSEKGTETYKIIN